MASEEASTEMFGHRLAPFSPQDQQRNPPGCCCCTAKKKTHTKQTKDMYVGTPSHWSIDKMEESIILTYLKG